MGTGGNVERNLSRQWILFDSWSMFSEIRLQSTGWLRERWLFWRLSIHDLTLDDTLSNLTPRTVHSICICRLSGLHMRGKLHFGTCRGRKRAEMGNWREETKRRWTSMSQPVSLLSCRSCIAKQLGRGFTEGANVLRISFRILSPNTQFLQFGNSNVFHQILLTQTYC